MAKSAIASKTPKEQLDEARIERATLRGRQVKYNNLSPKEEARLTALEAEIESLEKNLAIEGKKNLAKRAAQRARKKDTR